MFLHSAVWPFIHANWEAIQKESDCSALLIGSGYAGLVRTLPFRSRVRYRFGDRELADDVFAGSALFREASVRFEYELVNAGAVFRDLCFSLF